MGAWDGSPVFVCPLRPGEPPPAFLAVLKELSVIEPCPSGHGGGLTTQAWPILVSHLLGNNDWSKSGRMTHSRPVWILHWDFYMDAGVKSSDFLLELLN